MVGPADRAMAGDRFVGTKEYYRVFSYLIQTAESRELGNYGRVAEIMNLPPQGHHMAQQTGQMLGEISRHEHERSRPLLSALVTRAGDHRPGDGFYELARQLGRLPENASRDQKLAFWEAERDAVYEEWSG